MKNHPHPVIFDEIQRADELLLEIKFLVDQNPNSNGCFILVGSQPMPLMQQVSESLAGRVGILELPPLTVRELNHFERGGAETHIKTIDDLLSPPIGEVFPNPMLPLEILTRGFFPAMALKQHSADVAIATQRLSDYVQTYLNRDLRDLSAIKDLGKFESFTQQLALYAAKPVNLRQLSSSVSLPQSTAHEWVHLLKASHLYRQISGYSKKLGKRKSKLKKGVFIDPGLVTHLLGYNSENQLSLSPMLGFIFENAIINLIFSLTRPRLRESHILLAASGTV